jgi:TonB family protein
MKDTTRLACGLLLAAIVAPSCVGKRNRPKSVGDEKSAAQSLSDAGIKPLAPYPTPFDTGLGDVDPDAVYFDFQVEKQAVPLPSNAPPHYPIVHFLGMQGSVLAEFIVDTTGRVLPGSVRVMRTANEQLDQPVLNAVRSMRFEPATIHGRRVKELLEMTFTFPRSAS